MINTIWCSEIKNLPSVANFQMIYVFSSTLQYFSLIHWHLSTVPYPLIICCDPSLPVSHLCPSVRLFLALLPHFSPLSHYSSLCFVLCPRIYAQSRCCCHIFSFTSSTSTSSCSCFVIAAALNEFYIFIARPSSESFLPASGYVWTGRGYPLITIFFHSLFTYRFVTSIAALRLLFVVTLHRRVPVWTTLFLLEHTRTHKRMQRASAHKYHMWIVQRMLCTHAHTHRELEQYLLGIYALKQPQSTEPAKRAITRHSGKIVAFSFGFSDWVSLSLSGGCNFYWFWFSHFCFYFASILRQVAASNCSLSLPPAPASVATCHLPVAERPAVFSFAAQPSPELIGQFVASATCRKINQAEPHISFDTICRLAANAACIPSPPPPPLRKLPLFKLQQPPLKFDWLSSECAARSRLEVVSGIFSACLKDCRKEIYMNCGRSGLSCGAVANLILVA